MLDQIDSAISAVPFLRLEPDGSAYLSGSECSSCHAVVPGERLACASCGTRHGIKAIQLGNCGTVQSHTIVHKSYPGTVTPFVSVVVRLKGGAILKGTLLDVAPASETIPFDMEVNVVYRDTGQRNSKGQRFISYYFVPAPNDSK